MRKILYTMALLCAASLSGCSTTDQDEAEASAVATNPQSLFETGIQEINQSDYKTAVQTFESLEKEHPASKFAPEAQVRRAYAQYLDGKFDEAIIAVDDFVKQYPVHDSIAYMYYLKGLCYYDQIVDPERDQQLTIKAIEAMQEVVARFPDSQYARDAKLKIEFAHNNLAGKEMEIASYYQRKNQLIAALARYKTIIEQYQISIFTPEALYRVVEIFYSLGDEKQAQRYAAVLGHNYPDSEWYQMAYSLMIEKNGTEPESWYQDLKKIW